MGELRSMGVTCSHIETVSLMCVYSSKLASGYSCGPTVSFSVGGVHAPLGDVRNPDALPPAFTPEIFSSTFASTRTRELPFANEGTQIIS